VTQNKTLLDAGNLPNPLLPFTCPFTGRLEELSVGLAKARLHQHFFGDIMSQAAALLLKPTVVTRIINF
jgi:hypothetical protein